MAEELKTTPLNAWHRNAGANMADFGGYDMPLWYSSGVKAEHLSVLTSAGFFDTSHMACVLVSGIGAFELLQQTHTRDLTSLIAGRCVYGAFLDRRGHVIDDAIIYCFADADFMVCVNAGMGNTIAAHLAGIDTGLPCNIKDMSGQIGKIDIQGKQAARILGNLIQEPEAVYRNMPYFSFKGHFDPSSLLSSQVRLIDGTPILLSRSGYTGEFGFEVFIDPDRTEAFWNDLINQGKHVNALACGLGARDSLRTGAILPLSHQDIGDRLFTNHPWMFALPLTKDGKGFTKEFIGDKALLSASNVPHTLAFVGDDLRKVNPGPGSRVLTEDGTDQGHVLSCATDMGITWHDNRIISIASPDFHVGIPIRGLSCGFVYSDTFLAPGTRILLQEGKRKLNATIVNDIRPDRTARLKIDHFIE